MVTLDEKYSFVAANVTLDGRPAKIAGAKLDCATIWHLDTPSHGVHFAWKTVKHIIKRHNGKFHS